MRWILALALLSASATVVEAKKKTSTVVKKEKEMKPPPPNDPRLNEGAQGRRNAVNDAANASQGPWNERRP